MKIKHAPEDFRVEEVSRLEVGNTGGFTVYRLEKRGIGTPEAVRQVAKRWQLPREALGVSGLKDTHGHTGQMLTIRAGPARNLDGGRWKLNYLGRSNRPATRAALVANRFRIVVRELNDPVRFCGRAERAAEIGFTGGRFIADSLLAGDFESALRLAIASPDGKDRSAVRRRRVALRDGWGDWAALCGSLPESFERNVAQRLADGATFAEAYTMIDRELRRLHLSAYQAHRFNEQVRGVITTGPEWPGVEGPYRFHEEPIEDRTFELGVFGELAFRPGRRHLLCRPEKLRVEPAADAAELAFTLRPGSYATMLIKRCASGTTAP
jgi:tRNA pseudouridine13 synthase